MPKQQLTKQLLRRQINTPSWAILLPTDTPLLLLKPWKSKVVDLDKEIGKRTTTINFEPLETQYLLRISTAVQRDNALSFRNIFTVDRNFSGPWVLYIYIISIIKPTGFVLVGELEKNCDYDCNNNIIYNTDNNNNNNNSNNNSNNNNNRNSKDNKRAIWNKQIT